MGMWGGCLLFAKHWHNYLQMFRLILCQVQFWWEECSHGTRKGDGREGDGMEEGRWEGESWRKVDGREEGRWAGGRESARKRTESER